MSHAQIHRFGDAVAVSVGKGETCYMTAKEARKIARALSKAARSCDTETFQASTCGTFEMQFDGSIQR